ncbi:MAG: ankyrin repeat domain-containing protein [Planctomycetia bacterium]|nr:ankyrin repeat domain-containing protein [Planctomycetia bacterium]
MLNAPPPAADDPDLASLFEAIQKGELEKVEALLRQKPDLVHGREKDGQSPLHIAAEYDDARIGLLLLTMGADPRARFGETGHTPLSWAVTCHALSFAKAMVHAGIKPDLFTAAGMGSLELVKLCFDDQGQLQPDSVVTGSTRFDQQGNRLPCPPISPSEQVADALYMACRNGQLEIVRFLLTRQPDLAFRAYMGGTLLHWAYFGCNTDVINEMLQAGCDATARDDNLSCIPKSFGICTPANWGFLELVERQLRRDPTLANFMDGQTSALHEAASKGHVEIVKLLLRAGVNPQLLNGTGQTATDLAKANGHQAVVDLLSI